MNAAIKWDDGTAQNVATPVSSSFMISHTYTNPGVYSIVVILTDAC